MFILALLTIIAGLGGMIWMAAIAFQEGYNVLAELTPGCSAQLPLVGGL